MHHWADDKIRVHAFYCMLGITLLQYIHKKVQAVWPGLSTGQLIEQLQEIQQFTLL
jgi:transposase